MKNTEIEQVEVEVEDAGDYQEPDQADRDWWRDATTGEDDESNDDEIDRQADGAGWLASHERGWAAV